MKGSPVKVKAWAIWTPDCGFFYQPQFYQTRREAVEARGVIFEQVSMCRSFEDLRVVRIEITALPKKGRGKCK